MENLTIYGSVDQDVGKAIQRLRERNVGIVIRDESELNAIRIQAEKNKYVETHSDKGKGKEKENEAPEVASCGNFMSKAVFAQRQRRERERTDKLQTKHVIQPKRPTPFPGLPPRSCRSRESWPKRPRVVQIPLDKTIVTPNLVDYSLRRISPLTDSMSINQADVQLPPVILPRNLYQDFNVSHMNNVGPNVENAQTIVACPFLTSTESVIHQETPNHVDHNISDIAKHLQIGSQPPSEEILHSSPNQLVCPEINSSSLLGQCSSNYANTSTFVNCPENVDLGKHYLGMMNVMCPHCSALHWMDEKLQNSSIGRPLFGKCCLQGQVRLPPLIEPPPEIKFLFDGNDVQSKSFRSNTREYNAVNAFTSLGVQMDDRVIRGNGPSSFTIHGALRHRTGALLPKLGHEATYAQLYIYDPVQALDIRECRNPSLRRDVLKTIQDCLLVNNAFTSKFRQAFAILERSDIAGKNLPAYLHYNSETDRRRYNLPSTDEIAIILPGHGTQVTGMRDIIVHYKGGNQLMQSNECHPAYLPLHYVLLFPHGQLGWESEIKLWDVVHQRHTGKRLTQLNYYGYRLFQHGTEYSTILRGGKLFQEFIVDAWASTEQNRLTYYRLNQGTFRSELYQGLADSMSEGLEADQIGKRIVLPSSFTGSARHMFEIFQDSMAITRFNQHPDIFLTMTANPKWPEITSALLPNQNATDRPDLVARVFELKRKALMKEIEKKKVFGKKVAHMFTIEFQKRGLPHMHTLIFLDSSSKIKTCAQVDKIVCAEFPDPDEDHVLFQTILGCMVHGPCGKDNPKAPCMENGKCTKKYPRGFSDSTTMDEDGYPIYRRRNDGREYFVRKNRFDNRDVVPYNPYLSRMFNCHINVEVCAGLRCVKYIHKYIYKGFDRTTMVLGGVDEIQQYLDARYIGPPEAAWRIFGNPLHEEFPSVVRLAVHLPGMHHVVFNPEESTDAIISRAAVQMTTLTGFFACCASNESARVFTYQEFPQHFVWNKTQKIWTPRKQGNSIGRMYFASPSSGERFYLRLLLTVVRGPTSYEDLRTVNNILHDTFKSACVARGLLEDDGEWVQCLQEAAIMRTGYQLRRLFSVILTQCMPLDPNLLWNQFAMDICDDLAHKIHTLFAIPNPTDSQIKNYGLYLLNQLLQESGKNLTDFPPMAQPVENWNTIVGNKLIWEHRQLQSDAEKSDQSNVDCLNEGQRIAYTAITSSVFENKGTTFFF